LVGEALAPLREKVVIATKFGFTNDPATAGHEQPARAHQAERGRLH
jgi:aryl-alcohol dehydrogenase-like predicted oxidoreductase